MSKFKIAALLCPALIGLTVAASAQQTPPQAATANQAQSGTVPKAASATAPDAGRDKLVLLFASGSAALDQRNDTILDHASRLYRAGHPVMMIVSGSTDTTGSAEHNLILSQERADAVIHGLIARGIPATRTQLFAKGETDLAVPTAQDVAKAQNRRVEITWH